MPCNRVILSSFCFLLLVQSTLPAQEVPRLKGHDGYIGSLAFAPDEKILASSGAVFFKYGEIKLWDIHDKAIPALVALFKERKHWPEILPSLANSTAKLARTTIEEALRAEDDNDWIFWQARALGLRKSPESKPVLLATIKRVNKRLESLGDRGTSFDEPNGLGVMVGGSTDCALFALIWALGRIEGKEFGTSWLCKNDKGDYQLSGPLDLNDANACILWWREYKKTLDKKDGPAKKVGDGAEPLSGNWRVVEALPTSGLERLTFDREKITIVHSATRKRNFRYQIDAKANPARIDVLHEDGSKCLGIYEVDGDALRICLGPWLGERPVDFTSKGKHIVVLTLVREEVADQRHVEKWEGVKCFATRDAKQVGRDGQRGQPVVGLDFIGCELKDSDLKKLADVKGCAGCPLSASAKMKPGERKVVKVSGTEWANWDYFWRRAEMIAHSWPGQFTMAEYSAADGS